MTSPTRVTVYRGYDPIQAQIVADLLRQDGLDAIVQGGHASTIFGAGQSFLEVRVLAPADAEERARELIAAYAASDEDVHAAAEASGAPDRPRIAPEARAPRRRPPLMALGIAAILPGGGHFYARRAWTGLAVLCSQIGAVVTMAGRDAITASGAALAALAIFAFDGMGGAFGAAAYNRGARPGALAQLATAAAALGIIATIAALAAPHLAAWRPRKLVEPGSASPWHRPELRDRALAPDELPFPLHLDLEGRRTLPR